MKDVKEIADKLNKMEPYFCENDCGDNRISLDSEYKIDVHAPTMGKKTYKKMEKAIDKACITKDEYEVYAWNDVSGWDYWKKEGKNEGIYGMNYIMVTANIKDTENIDISELKQDMESVWSMVNGYHNFDEIDVKYFL